MTLQRSAAALAGRLIWAVVARYDSLDSITYNYRQIRQDSKKKNSGIQKFIFAKNKLVD